MVHEMAGVQDVRRLSDELGVSLALYLGANDVRKLQTMIVDASNYVQTEHALINFDDAHDAHG